MVCSALSTNFRSGCVPFGGYRRTDGSRQPTLCPDPNAIGRGMFSANRCVPRREPWERGKLSHIIMDYCILQISDFSHSDSAIVKTPPRFLRCAFPGSASRILTGRAAHSQTRSSYRDREKTKVRQERIPESSQKTSKLSGQEVKW